MQEIQQPAGQEHGSVEAQMPENATARCLKYTAIGYRAVGRIGLAMRLFQEGIQLATTVGDIRQATQMLYRLGHACARCEMTDEAIECYQKVGNLSLAGDLALAQGRIHAAINYYKQSDYGTETKLARALFVKGDYEQALNVFAVVLQAQKQLRALGIDRHKFGNGPEDAIRHLIMSGEAVEHSEFRSQFEDARIRILSEFKARWARITSLQGNAEVETDAPDECDHKAGQFRRDVAAIEECGKPMVLVRGRDYIRCTREQSYHIRFLTSKQDCLIMLVGLRQRYVLVQRELED